MPTKGPRSGRSTVSRKANQVNREEMSNELSRLSVLASRHPVATGQRFLYATKPQPRGDGCRKFVFRDGTIVADINDALALMRSICVRCGISTD